MKISDGKVSIIIPVYNAEKTIKKCIRSIITQTYTDIEVVCVDDGSTDSSKQVIEDLHSQDKRIVLISQENSGAYMSRKTGIFNATGNYIMFVDADDELFHKNAISELVSYFKTYTDVQIVQFGHRLYRTRLIAKNECIEKLTIISFDDLKNKYYQELVGWTPKNTISFGTCGKIYKSNLLKSALIENETRLKLCEDKLMSLQIYFSGLFEKSLIVPCVYYKYKKYLGYSKDFDYTVFSEYGDLKKYQNYLCDHFFPPRAKFDCNIETVYYFMVIVKGLIGNNTSKETVKSIIAEMDGYDFVKYAKEYLRSFDDKRLINEEIEFLSSDYSPEEYYDYVLSHSSKDSIKKKMMHKAVRIMRKIGL